MVTKKAASTAKAIVQDPATFDVAGWLADLSAQGFMPQNVTMKLHLRGDLLPRIKQLVDQIQTNQDIDDQREYGVDDADPMAGVVAEYEALTQEFRDGGSLDFVFRPMTKRIHTATYKAWLAQYPGDKHSDDEFEELILARMVETCVDFPGRGGSFGEKLTVEALHAFEEAYGTPAFNTLAVGFNDAYNAGGEVGAPFLPERSPTPDTDG
jgi:hypothetical protein